MNDADAQISSCSFGAVRNPESMSISKQRRFFSATNPTRLCGKLFMKAYTSSLDAIDFQIDRLIMQAHLYTSARAFTKLVLWSGAC